jgi:hypothetical protein
MRPALQVMDASGENLMNTGQLIVLLVLAAIVVVGGVAAWLYMQRRRTEELAGQYGPEYQRAVEEHGDRRRAEEELVSRRERVRALEIQPLDPERARGYKGRWVNVQADFVDHPDRAIFEADRLVGEVMEERGYPIGDFERQAEDVSVDHPRVVADYRAAHLVAERHSRNPVNTEELRRAMVDYRTLFDDLIETEERATEAPEPAGVNR